MNSYEKHLFAKGLAKSTVRCYNDAALSFMAWLDGQNTDIDNATSGDVTAFLAHLRQKGQENITRRNNLIAVRHFFDYRIAQEQRKDNPANHIKIRGIKRRQYPILSMQELEIIYNKYAVPPEQPQQKWVTGKRVNTYKVSRLSRQRNKVILGLMIWQGLATPEINNLAMADLKLREGTVYIRGGRGSEERTLELKPAQIMELMEYQLQTRKELLTYCSKERQETEKRLFLPVPASGQKVTTDNNAINVWKRLGQDIKAISPRFINFQQVRNSVITHWLRQHNLRQVQYMAGHKYVSSTEAFKVNNIEELQEDINKFHPLG
jgi:site-specific recombinase XerD